MICPVRHFDRIDFFYKEVVAVSENGWHWHKEILKQIMIERRGKEHEKIK